MPQCTNYPNGCNGQVKLDKDDSNFYCENHFYKYERMKNKFVMVGGLKRYLKTSVAQAETRRNERAVDKGKTPPIPPRGGRP